MCMSCVLFYVSMYMYHVFVRVAGVFCAVLCVACVHYVCCVWCTLAMTEYEIVDSVCFFVMWAVHIAIMMSNSPLHCEHTRCMVG